MTGSKRADVACRDPRDRASERPWLDPSGIGSSALPRQNPGSDEGFRRPPVQQGTIDHAPPENVIRVPALDAERVAGPIVAEGHQRRIQKPVSSCLHSPRDESVERPHHPPLTGFVEVAVALFVDTTKPARQGQAYRCLGGGELILGAASHTTTLSEHRQEAQREIGYALQLAAARGWVAHKPQK